MSDPKLVRLGRELKAARKLLGLRQVDVAAALGVANSIVHYYEVGAIEPPTLRLFHLAGLLRLNLDALAVRVGSTRKRRSGAILARNRSAA